MQGFFDSPVYFRGNHMTKRELSYLKRLEAEFKLKYSRICRKSSSKLPIKVWKMMLRIDELTRKKNGWDWTKNKMWISGSDGEGRAIERMPEFQLEQHIRHIEEKIRCKQYEWKRRKK